MDNNEYINRINIAIDYINENISEELNIRKCSKSITFLKISFS